MLYFKCRSTFSCLLVVLLGAPSLFAQDDEGELSKMQQDFFAAAQSIQVWGGSSGTESFELLPRGALSWSNPVRRTAAGGLFLWTLDGRPQVAMCVYPSTPTTFDHEFQSLSLFPLAAKVEDESIWEPLKAGIEFLPLEKVAPPARASQCDFVKCEIWPENSRRNSFLPSEPRSRCDYSQRQPIVTRHLIRPARSLMVRCLRSSRPPIRKCF